MSKVGKKPYNTSRGEVLFMIFKASKTYKNLMTAFENESEAYTRYSIYSQKAREDGFNQISDIFQETAHNELSHALIWLTWLGEKDEFPYTFDNLKGSWQLEKDKSDEYHSFYVEAKKEGFATLAALFEKVGRIEENHGARFALLVENMDRVQVFCKDLPQVWICTACGHETKGECSPEICPVCGHSQSFTQLKCENY